MATATRIEKMTEAEFLALPEAPGRREWINGEVLCMGSASVSHVAVSTNILVSLATRLAGKPCRPFNGDLRVHITETGAYLQPDVTVVCGGVETHPHDPKHSVINPRVVFEVLSPSTEAYDRGAKRRHYQSIASLQEYVLVSQDERVIDHYLRMDDGDWRVTAHTGSAVMRLPSIDVELSLDDIYAGVEDYAPADSGRSV